MHNLWQSPVFISVITAAIVAAVVSISLYRRFPLHLIYRSKVKLEDMLDAIGDPLAVIDTDYIIQRINRAYATLVNYTYSDAIGQRCYRLLRKRKTPCPDCKMVQSLQLRSSEVVETTEHPSGNGAISITFSPYTSQYTGERASIIEHIRDITTLEQLKIDLEKKNRTLGHALREIKAAQQNTRDELRVARQIQQGILPKHAPQFDGLKIALTYHPVADVGGDIYDFITFTDDHLGVFIGDASGHGLSSAFVGTISKMSLYNHSKAEMPPGELLSRINHDLISNVHSSHYLTCFWAIFDMRTGTLTYSRAGHPMPVVLHKDGSIRQLAGNGTFIGIIDGANYEECSYTFEKGDRILLFTDGIYEVLNVSDKSKDGDVLGYDKFVSLLSECNNLPFSKLVTGIQHRLSEFTYEDDYTLIAIEVTGRGAKTAVDKGVK